MTTTNMARPITIASIYYICMPIAIAVAMRLPFSSSVYSEYVYNYEATVLTGLSGFKITAKAHLELLYVSPGGSGVGDSGGSGGQLFRLRLIEPVFHSTAGHTLTIDRKYESMHNPNHDLYAHIVTLSNGTAYIKQLYTHQADSDTFRNLKKSILLNLLPTSHHMSPRIHETTNKEKQAQHNLISQLAPVEQHFCVDDNNHAQPELFSPDSISQVNIIAKPITNSASSASSHSATDTTTNNLLEQPSLVIPTVFQTVEGYQNVTFRSRVFSQAESNLTTSFHLELINELKSNAHETFDQATTIDDAIPLIDRQTYQPDTVELQRERRICSNNHCKQTLAQLFQEYKDRLTDESLASIEAAVAFLKILDRLRQAQGSTVADITAILKRMKGNYGVRSSFLDILASARTKQSITAALKHIRLTKTKNTDLDTAERFLSVLSVAAKTAAKMHPKRPLYSPYYFKPTPALKQGKVAREQEAQMASIEFIVQEFLNILKQTPAENWLSQKLRWSTLLTLATLVNAYNQEHNFESLEDELNQKVSSLLLRELEECDKSDMDCRVVVLHAIGNVGHLGDDQFQTIKKHVLNSGGRESISAMKVLRDLLQHQAKDKPLNQAFYTDLKDLLLRVVYDSSQETTARILSAEMIVKFVPNSLASIELLNNLPSFGNTELATMIFLRMQSLRPDSLAQYHENWYWKSCIINGTSTSFVRTMAKTDSLNASYGVNVELMKSKLPKESSFDVFLDTKQRTQDLFSLGLFTRGLSGVMGSQDDGAGDENESATAGMTLRLLGGYLRPYVFFTGYQELMSHVWRGTSPTTAFEGDLLLVDHEEGYPLISGFVAEQQMRGVLSIDVTGESATSLWNRNSHSKITTKAAVLVQASQSVFTVYDNFWYSHLFSFGGQALINFVADIAFSQMPPKVCLQVTQPEFLVRYNSRRHEQMMNEVSRRITRRNLPIGAKSYSLDSENNKMCSYMSEHILLSENEL